MKKPARVAWLGVVLVGLLAVQRAGGIPVHDAANLIQNSLQKAYAVLQHGKIVLQLAEIIDDKRKLEISEWREVGDLLAEINAAMAFGQAIAYSAEGAQASLATTFPVNFAIGVENEPIELIYPYWTNVARDTYAGALGVVGTVTGDDVDLSNFLVNFKALANTVTGRDRNQQASMMLSGTQLDELRKLQHSVAAMVNVMAVEKARNAAIESSTHATGMAMVFHARWDNTPNDYDAYRAVDIF